MNNLALEMIDEAIETMLEVTCASDEPKFVIDTDQKAEWAMLKLKEEYAEYRRMEMLCNNMISQYKERLEKAKTDYKQKTGYFEGWLHTYFVTVPHSKTKTQETYKLPSGTLKKKYGGVDYVRDDEKIVNWLRVSGNDKFVKVKESPDWAELKKITTVSENAVVTNDGEVVEGVVVVAKEDKFEIELD